MRSSPRTVQKTFKYGSLEYRYTLIPHTRKALRLTVTPEQVIILHCPLDADTDRIEKFLKKKAYWLGKQLRFFGKYQRTEYVKEYVSGESFYYLGRQYQLVVKRASKDRVVLSREAITVYTTRPVTMMKYTKALLDLWFRSTAEEVFLERFNRILERFEYKHTPSLGIRDMKKRWGSCVEKRKILLNPKLIRVSSSCIDYVITHELCHVRFKNHDKKFFAFLDEQFPHWENVKEKLELQGAAF